MIVSHSNVEGGETEVELPPDPPIGDGSFLDWGACNKNENPRFIDPLEGDGRVFANSPCANAGDDSQLPLDFGDLNLDGNVDEDEVTPLDLDLQERVRGSSVDMGAYEVEPCTADINGNGLVDVQDLVQVILEWGACPEPADSCLVDIAPETCNDGLVNVTDLVAVILAGGPCPGMSGQVDPVPQTVQDCLGWVCSGEEDYDECVQNCVQKLCDAQLISGCE